MKPILIATPRSGSTVIAEIMGHLSKQWFDYRGYLGEVFAPIEYQTTRQRLMQTPTGLELQLNSSVDPLTERARRIFLLAQDPDYMIKVFANHLDDDLLQWITATYTPIILKRRNKLQQFLSLIAMNQHDRTQEITEITYESRYLDQMIKHYEEFDALVEQFPNATTIYYEDWLENGATVQALIDLLQWPQLAYREFEITTQASQHSGDLESLIVNQDEWLQDKTLVLQRLGI